MNVDLFLRYAPRLADGALVTAALVLLSVLIGAAISLPMGLARLSDNRALRAAAFAYCHFFRGTPLLAQVFMVYYGAGQFRAELEAVGLWSLFRDAFFCAVFTFTLNTSAYQAEILRGAVLAVPAGQWEAAEALGLKRLATYFRVILPQAFITALRPLGNEIILMIKASAIASVITVFDLMGATRLAFARSFDFEVYLWAAVLYLAIVETMRRGWDRLEIRLTRHLRMAP